MYKIRRVDENQAALVDAFRKLGVKVLILSEVGNGCPDILCAFPNGRMRLVEIKDGSKSPSQRKLTQEQVKFHGEWVGYVSVVSSVGEVMKIVREIKNGDI